MTISGFHDGSKESKIFQYVKWIQRISCDIVYSIFCLAFENNGKLNKIMQTQKTAPMIDSFVWLIKQ